MTARELWTVERCAEQWGVTPSTWRSYVASGHAPQPLPGYDENRRRRWDAETVRSYPRPGRGARTDLTTKQPAVTNVYYPHRDDTLYPESEELRKGAVRSITAVLDGNPGLPSIELAGLIDAALRGTWQMNADAVAPDTEIRVHFLPPGHPDVDSGAHGPDHLILAGVPHVVGWRTDSGQVSGMTIRSARLLDAQGNPVDTVRHGST